MISGTYCPLSPFISSIMSTITIGFANSKPNERLVKFVRKIIEEEQSGTSAPSFDHEAIPYSSELSLLDDRFKDPTLTTPIDATTVYQYSIIGNAQEELPADTQLFVIDITKAHKYARRIKTLLKDLKDKKCAFLLLNPKSDGFQHIILKYDGTPVSSTSILAFPRLFPAAVEHAGRVTLISPSTFRKSQIAIEKQFVKTATQYYKDMGFIKLPLNNVRDFFDYAEKSHIDLLVLSKQDLNETMKIITTKAFNEQLKEQGLSIFMA